MFDREESEKASITAWIEVVEAENRLIKQISGTPAYRRAVFFRQFKQDIQSEGWPVFPRYFRLANKVLFSRIFGKNPKYPLPEPTVSAGNPFSKDRIAVYTCILGSYDLILEPLIRPDNCDYYMITDQELPVDSAWKRIDVSAHREQVPSDSPVLINRFFKMHPEILFPKYRYSVYIDGNILICSDVTKFCNKLSPYGLSAFYHPVRSCVYDEAQACFAQRRDTKTNLKNTVSFLRKQGMPEGYGLLTCNVLVREHHLEICQKLMKEWWELFLEHPKRDQLLMPYVLYKNNIRVSEVATLGQFTTDGVIRLIDHKV